MLYTNDFQIVLYLFFPKMMNIQFLLFLLLDLGDPAIATIEQVFTIGISTSWLCWRGHARRSQRRTNESWNGWGEHLSQCHLLISLVGAVTHLEPHTEPNLKVWHWFWQWGPKTKQETGYPKWINFLSKYGIARSNNDAFYLKYAFS